MRNYRNITKYLILTSIIFSLGLCSGCGESEKSARIEDNAYASNEFSHSNSDTDSATPENEESAQKAPTPSGNEEPPQDAANLTGNENPSQTSSTSQEPQTGLPESSDSQSKDDISDEPLIGTPLTKEELQTYTELIQQPSNYGFLLSDWDKPTDINLYEVFYNGAGISRDGTETEIQAFLKRNGQDELYTDFFVLDKTAVSNFLLEKIGVTYDEFVMKGGRGMEEIYYAESDSFCLEVGDTNYLMFECTDGVKNEEGTIVTLRYESEYSWIEKGVVQMWEDGSSFRSNHILKGDFLDTLQPDTTAQ